jgi:hypothetical protein
VPADEDGCREIARRARGTPRIAGRLLRRVVDFALVEAGGGQPRPGRPGADPAGGRHLGLDGADRRYLTLLAEHYGGGPVGVETIAAALSEPRDAIEEVIEPYLLQQGLIQRTPARADAGGRARGLAASGAGARRPRLHPARGPADAPGAVGDAPDPAVHSLLPPGVRRPGTVLPAGRRPWRGAGRGSAPHPASRGRATRTLPWDMRRRSGGLRPGGREGRPGSLQEIAMTADEIAALFTRPDGSFLCARWGRPIVPVVFGVDDATLATVKAAIEAVVALAGHRMAETDPELGANLMLFFFRDWEELPQVPNLDRLVPGLVPLCARLAAEGANQFRLFRFDAEGAIRAVFVFLRMDAALAEMPAADLALAQAAGAILSWGDGAFAAEAPLARAGGTAILRPVIAGLIRAAYDPTLPPVMRDSSHALRLAARLGPV